MVDDKSGRCTQIVLEVSLATILNKMSISVGSVHIYKHWTFNQNSHSHKQNESTEVQTLGAICLKYIIKL